MLTLSLGGCVKKSDFDTLLKENQQLQTRIDQGNEQLVQTRADLSALQARMQELLGAQSKLQKTQEQLQKSQQELETLRAEFEKFRSQRRSAMVGRKFPILTLDAGRVLKDAEITLIAPDEITFRHTGGVVKVAMAETTDDLRWEACYDPVEAKAKARERMLAQARALDEKLARERSTPLPSSGALPATAASPVEALKQQLASQRNRLNADYQTLAAKNPNVLQGTNWNSAAPEASPLLNSVSGSRAVLGISRLQSQRDAILQTLQQLRSLDPASR